jgi:hypothetical protein
MAESLRQGGELVIGLASLHRAEVWFR